MQVIPFSLVSKIELNDLYFCNSNTKKFKCPFIACNSVRKIFKNCTQCNLCNMWAHFKFSALTLY